MSQENEQFPSQDQPEISDQVLDPATATTEDVVDEETRQSFDNIIATQKFIATSIEEQRALLLQQAEIADLLERADELGKCEYFDVHYFTEQSKRCWQEREQADASPIELRPNAVRLFPNQETVDKQRELRERLREDHALEDREALKQRHPLLFNRVVRDESRRALFDRAVVARRNFETRNTSDSALLLLTGAETHMQPPLLTASAVNNNTTNKTIHSCAVTISKPTKASSYSSKPFPAFAPHVRHDVQNAAASPPRPPIDIDELMANAQRIVDNVTADSTNTPAEVQVQNEPTLGDLLRQQRQQLVDLQKRDETVYQPLLERYLLFNETVKERLFALAE